MSRDLELSKLQILLNILALAKRQIQKTTSQRPKQESRTRKRKRETSPEVDTRVYSHIL